MERTLETAGGVRPGHPFWLWPGLLSVDAPLVALAWQDFLARCYPVTLRPGGRIALGLTVWAIYIADRLLDVRRPAAPQETPRHAFYRRHRSFWLLALTVLIGADILVAISLVRPAVREEGLFIVPGVLLYLLVFVLPGRNKTVWKKLMAGLFFTAGVFLVELTANRTMFWPALAFFLLVEGNLLLVENWEHGRNPSYGWKAMAILALLCLAFGLRGEGPWFLALAISASALSALAFFQNRLPADARGVLADVALLCPLLFR